MKHILIILFLFLSISAIAQQGSLSQSVYKSRVNDTTTVAFTDAIAAAVAAGYSYEFWNNQATTPHTDKYTAAGVEHIFTWAGSGGASLTAGSGITLVGDSINWNGPITEDVVMNGVFGVDWGQTTALTRFRPQAQYIKITAIDSLNLSIGGTFGTPNQVLKTDGTKASWQNDTGTGSVNTFAKNTQSGNYTLQQSDTVRTILMSSASNQTLTIPTGMKGGSIFMVLQDSTNTVTLDASAVTVDENTSGTLTLTKGFMSTIFYKNSNRVVISKNSAASGGGATAAGATGNVQYKSAGGGLQAEADYTYDSATNILTVPLLKITSGSPGSGKVLQSDADGDASWATATQAGAQDLFISAAAMWPRVTSGCSGLTQVEVATSLFNIQSLDFSTSVGEYAQFQVSLPRNWNNGTITATVYWTATAGTGTVQWEVSAGAYSNDDPLTGALGTAIPIDDTLIATSDVHVSPTSTAITVAGTPADSDFLAIQIFRDVANDTLTADAKLLGVRLTITLDAVTSE